MDSNTTSLMHHQHHSPKSSRPSSGSFRGIVWFVVLFIFLVIISAFIAFYVHVTPPQNFPQERVVFSLPSGQRTGITLQQLKDKDIIRSVRLAKFFIWSSNLSLLAGDYAFSEPQGLFEILQRFSQGNYGDARIRVTLPEGTTIQGMADIFEKNIPEFDRDQFLALTKNKEGYLFPDTYFFFPSVRVENIVLTLTQAMDQQLESLSTEIASSGKSVQEILIMASIIEREAYDHDDERKTIAGILWKRLRIGMALQVDAPFVYILGKGSSELTRADLAIDSPYNTYRYKGLPPTPISNPGLSSIVASISPIESPYLYYLHDSQGKVYYSKTFDEHVRNKNIHLR